MKPEGIKKLLFIPIIAFCAEVAVAQQEPGYTMYTFNQLVINPAYAGKNATGALDLTLVAREQWVNLDGAPRTQSFSVSYGSVGKPMGLGLTIVNHKVGVAEDLSIFGAFSYKLTLNTKRRFKKNGEYVLVRSELSFGLCLGINSYIQNLSRVRTDGRGTGIDPSFAKDLSATTFNTGIGINFVNDLLFVGLSVSNLVGTSLGDANVGEINKNKRRPNVYFHLGSTFELNSILNIQPGVLLRYISGVPLEKDLNTILYYKKKIGVGINLKDLKYLDFILRLNILKNFRFGYSFDTMGRDFRLASLGSSHEFMFGYIFLVKSKNKMDLEVQYKHPRYF